MDWVAAIRQSSRSGDGFQASPRDYRPPIPYSRDMDGGKDKEQGGTCILSLIAGQRKQSASSFLASVFRLAQKVRKCAKTPSRAPSYPRLYRHTALIASIADIHNSSRKTHSANHLLHPIIGDTHRT